MAGRRVVPVVRGKRMQAAWGPVNIRTRITGGTTPTLGSTSDAALFTERVTIARLRGSVYVHMDAGAALDTMEVALGLIVVKEPAFTAGIASVPSPIVEIEQSWIWHHLFTMGPAVTATDDGGDISRNMRIEIDSKAQRKVQAGDILTFVWDTVILSGSPSFDGFASIRNMVLLS